MNQPFDETYRSAAQDPLNAPDQDFDWQGLYQRLSEEAGESDDGQRLAEALRRLIQMLVPDAERQIRVESVGLRVLALAWVLDPSYFGGSPSLRELARRCGVTQSALARHTGRYSRLLGWRSRAQQHAWNWRQATRPDEQRLIRPQRPVSKDPPAAVAGASPPCPTTPGTTAASCSGATGAKATPGTGCGTGRRCDASQGSNPS